MNDHNSRSENTLFNKKIQITFTFVQLELDLIIWWHNSFVLFLYSYPARLSVAFNSFLLRLVEFFRVNKTV